MEDIVEFGFSKRCHPFYQTFYFMIKDLKKNKYNKMVGSIPIIYMYYMQVMGILEVIRPGHSHFYFEIDLDLHLHPSMDFYKKLYGE